MNKEDVKAALKEAGVPFDEDAGYNDLRRLLKENEGAAPTGEKPTATTGETESDELARLRQENAALKVKASNKGIPTKTPGKNQKLLRNVDRLQLGFAKAMTHESGEKCSEQERQAVEYEIRKYVKRGGFRMENKIRIPIKGGYVKGLTPEELERAKGLLEFMGRDTENPEWDRSIAVLGMETM